MDVSRETFSRLGETCFLLYPPFCPVKGPALSHCRRALPACSGLSSIPFLRYALRRFAMHPCCASASQESSAVACPAQSASFGKCKRNVRNTAFILRSEMLRIPLLLIIKRQVSFPRMDRLCAGREDGPRSFLRPGRGDHFVRPSPPALGIFERSALPSAALFPDPHPFPAAQRLCGQCPPPLEALGFSLPSLRVRGSPSLAPLLPLWGSSPRFSLHWRRSVSIPKNVSRETWSLPGVRAGSCFT